MNLNCPYLGRKIIRKMEEGRRNMALLKLVMEKILLLGYFVAVFLFLIFYNLSSIT